MKGSKILVEMGCICFGLMLTVSMAEITQPYFSWFSRKKLVSLTSPENSDLPEYNHITTLTGNTSEGVGKTADVTATSLNAHGVNGTRNVTFPVEKRSVKRGGVDYFGDPISETAVSTNLHLRRISNGKNYFHGMNESGNPERLVRLERLSRYKRNAYKRAMETNGAKKERKGIEEEAEYRRMASAARRKEARDEKVKNVKSRREQLKNSAKSGGKEEKPRNNRPIKRKSTLRENGSKNLSNGTSSKYHHKSSAQKHKLKNKSKKKERTCGKSKCKTQAVVNRQKGSKTHITGQNMSVTKEWRKSHPGQGAQGNYSDEDGEHGSKETKKQGTIEKKQHKDDREKPDQKKEHAVKGKSDANKTTKKKKSAKNGSITSKNKIESSKKVSNKEVLEESDEETSSKDEFVENEKKSTKSSEGAEKSRTSSKKEMDGEKGSEESISSQNTASKKKGGKITAKKGKTGTEKRTQEESKDSIKTKTSAINTSKKSDCKKKDTEKSQKATIAIQKQGNGMEYLSPVLGLGLSSRKRTHSKAQAWSRIALRRPMTGGYASSGRLTRASSNLYGAYASAGV